MSWSPADSSVRVRGPLRERRCCGGGKTQNEIPAVRRSDSLSQHREREYGVARRHDQVLRAVQFIRDRTVADLICEAGMPQRLPVPEQAFPPTVNTASSTKGSSGRSIPPTRAIPITQANGRISWN